MRSYLPLNPPNDTLTECQVCFAVVERSVQNLHAEWHQDMARDLDIDTLVERLRSFTRKD